MKNTLSFLSVTALLLCMYSCSKTAATEPACPVPDGAITVHIGIDNAETKAAYNTTDFKDTQINTVQIFVFDAQGLLETDCYTSVTPASTATVTLATFTGAKTVYAVANHARETLAKDYRLTDFEEKILSDLGENTPTNLVMSGKNAITVTSYNRTGGDWNRPQSLDIYLKHLSTLIVLEKVTVDFSRTSLAGATFAIKELYLKNVVGKSRVGMSGNTAAAQAPNLPYILTESQFANSDNWYNKLTKQTTPVPPAVTFDECNITCSNVAGGDGTAMNRCLVAYPNATVPDSHDDTFCPRHTRLVLKAHVSKSGVITPAEGIDTYYVFDLPEINPNYIYKISNITLTMLGKDSDDKDDDLQQGRISPAITVDEWTCTTQLAYEF